MRLIGKYVNGNYKVAIFNDGTKIRHTDDNYWNAQFPENIDLKITNNCDMRCPYCHENSTIDGKHGDIMNMEFINTLMPYTEVAIGGGNALEHPYLVPFLQKLKERNIFANITVNQYHFMENLMLIQLLVERELIKGLGVSLMNTTEDFISEILKFENAVIHIINGVELVSNFKKLYDKDLKVLILGYKEFRRGKDYYSEKVEVRKNMLKEELPNLINHFQVVSFDNLALEQLDVTTLLGDKWNNFYMGDDGQFTMYIDAVTGTFGKSSTMPIADRLPITNNINDMFKIVKEMK